MECKIRDLEDNIKQWAVLYVNNSHTAPPRAQHWGVVDCICTGLCRVATAGSVCRIELVATDNISIFDATSALQWLSCCAEAAPVVPCASLFSGVTRT